MLRDFICWPWKNKIPTLMNFLQNVWYIFCPFFTYLGNILLKTIHMKTWTLIWITSYSKMMVRDIFHFHKVQASTMGLILLWILKCIHLHIMVIFFIAAMWKHWFKSVKVVWMELDPILHGHGPFYKYFLSKISKLFWRWKFISIGLIWHPVKVIES